MRDRLIELIGKKQVYGIDQEQKYDDELLLLDNEELADHLLANGVIVPPVKVGQSLFILEDIGIQTLPEIVPLTVYNLAFTVFEEGIKSHIVCLTKSRKIRHIKYENFGKTVFLTREEAVEALERSKNGN